MPRGSQPAQLPGAEQRQRRDARVPDDTDKPALEVRWRIWKAQCSPLGSKPEPGPAGVVHTCSRAPAGARAAAPAPSPPPLCLPDALRVLSRSCLSRRASLVGILDAFRSQVCRKGGLPCESPPVRFVLPRLGAGDLSSVPALALRSPDRGLIWAPSTTSVKAAHWF